MKFYRVVNILLIILAAIGGSHSDFRNCKDCGGVFTARQSILTSPKYPERYPSSVCCDYTVRSPYHCPTDFHIQFLDFYMESSLDCKNDFLAIGDDIDVDVSNYTGDILCGHVTGIRKHSSQDGILRVRFVANGVVEDRGFRLLITRLSCEDTSNIPNNQTHDEATIEQAVVTLPNLELLPPLQGQQTRAPAIDLAKQANNHQGDVFRGEEYLPPPTAGYLPNNPSYPFYPQSTAPPTPTNDWYLPPENPCPLPPWIQGNNYYPHNNNYPQQLPTGSCCAGIFRQQRLYLASPGFPARTDASPPRDCLYYIEKSVPSVCRLRVVFRFFALGSADAYSGQCLSDFIEIDGERMCGCRTGFAFASEWGLGAKVIRLKTNGPLSGTASIGFLLDITQEDCGIRYIRQVGDTVQDKHTSHAGLGANSSIGTKSYLHGRKSTQVGYPFNQGVNSKLFLAQTNPCEFGFADLLRISFDPLWLTRPRC